MSIIVTWRFTFDIYHSLLGRDSILPLPQRETGSLCQDGIRRQVLESDPTQTFSCAYQSFNIRSPSSAAKFTVRAPSNSLLPIIVRMNTLFSWPTFNCLTCIAPSDHRVNGPHGTNSSATTCTSIALPGRCTLLITAFTAVSVSVDATAASAKLSGGVREGMPRGVDVDSPEEPLACVPHSSLQILTSPQFAFMQWNQALPRPPVLPNMLPH
ncbi:hypothetical protein F5888DRAFT_1873479 [Russula emetica]|nr:hypothetical protein F5888DRAFT_1873479 [Russula emetica]